MGHLFNKKEPQQEGDTHPFDDTLRRLLSKLAMFHTISRSTHEVLSLGTFQSQSPAAWQESTHTLYPEVVDSIFRLLDWLSDAENALITC